MTGMKKAKPNADERLTRFEAARARRATERAGKLGAALAYATRGWALVPLRAPRSDGTCSCEKPECDAPGKHPYLKDWPRKATTEPATIRRWVETWPDLNLAVITGTRSGVVVLDVDPRNGGQGSLDYVQAKHGRLPRVPRVKTGSGGAHYYFLAPAEPVTTRPVLAGLELKGEHGSAVLPPSRHASGGTYTWEVPPDDALLVEPPGWLLSLSPERVAGRNGQSRRLSEEEVKQLLNGVPEGQRRTTTARLAGHFIGIGRPVYEVEAIMRDFASRCTPAFKPVEVDDALKIVRDFARNRDGQISPGGTGTQTAPVAQFQPVPVRELFAEPDKPVDWLWRPFVPAGRLTLLAAYMKVGKSKLAYMLALAVAQGRPLIDGPVQQGGVLILAVEEHKADIKRRLLELGARPSDPITVHPGRLTYSQATMAELRTFVTEQTTKLLILDTLGRYWGIENENDNAQIVKLADPWLDFAHGTGCAVLLIHHERKSGGQDGRGIRGGSALFALVDQALILERRQGGDQRTQRVLKTVGRYDESPSELVIELVGTTYRRLGTPEELSPDRDPDVILDVLSDEPKRIIEIVDVSGYEVKRVRAALKLLMKGKQVRRAGAGTKGSPHTYRRVG